MVKVHIYKYLSGEAARQVFETATLANCRERGYFEDEDAFIAFDFSQGDYKVMQYPMKWQAWAFASTDLSYDYIWEINEKEFLEMFNNALHDGV